MSSGYPGYGDEGPTCSRHHAYDNDCRDCHVESGTEAFYDAGHRAGVIIGEQRATQKIIHLLGDIRGIDGEMYPVLCDTIREHMARGDRIENHAGGREGEK